MTTPAALVLALAALFAVGDWISRVRHDQRLEYVCKPATMGALLLVAVLVDPQSDAQRWWFVGALAFSLLGDVLLMLPADRFVAGLAAFLVAHLCYVAGLLVTDPSRLALVVAGALVAVIVVPLAVVIVRGARRSGDEAVERPIVAYVAVISTMLAVALASGNALAAVGATLFVASDSMIAWNRFVRPFALASLAIMVTYHLGQAGLVLSLLT